MKKKIVRESIYTESYALCSSLYDLFDRSIDESINILESIKKEAEKAGYSNICTEVHGLGESYLEITGERLETDKEAEKRIKKEKQIKERQKKREKKKKEKELKELKRLAKKYPNEIK